MIRLGRSATDMLRQCRQDCRKGQKRSSYSDWGINPDVTIIANVHVFNTGEFCFMKQTLGIKKRDYIHQYPFSVIRSLAKLILIPKILMMRRVQPCACTSGGKYLTSGKAVMTWRGWLNVLCWEYRKKEGRWHVVTRWEERLGKPGLDLEITVIARGMHDNIFCTLF